jgi:hypothetical protein
MLTNILFSQAVPNLCIRDQLLWFKVQIYIAVVIYVLITQVIKF